MDNDSRFTKSQAENLLRNCTCCPRECKVDRTTSNSGWCRAGDGFGISSICAHHGEEPVFSGPNGICNIFFSHCNLQCIYCQNHQISDRTQTQTDMDIDEVLFKIEKILNYGATALGFVSPSHYIPQMRTIIACLRQRGNDPTFVYNSNGYDKLASIKSLENEINVYLPDLKYMDDGLALELSGAPHYSSIAGTALKEMFRQVGPELTLDKDGLATAGMVIRHLVLPGQVANSKAVLLFIAEELSTEVHISLMSQYNPTERVADHPTLGRCLRPEEYEEVVAEFERLGFYQGWVQEMSSSANYRPNFNRDHPFEH